jgi:hypothetical protein
MQLAAAKSGNGTVTGDPDNSSDSDYVGKHRPHRMSVLRSRVRVSQLAERDSDAQTK